MTNLGTKTLRGERLLLRRFTLDDAPAMFENWASDGEVTKYLTWPTHQNMEDSKAVLSDWVPKYDEDDGFYLWAIALDGVVIGSISVVDSSDKIEKAEIGYCIGRSWWGRGVMTGALGLVIDYLFREVSVNRIYARHDPRNAGSGKVMQKCGMIYEGTCRQADWNNSGVCDLVMDAILAEDYNAAT
jgi:ribosomal-protein-alanine N-acetyltransferase